MIIMVIKYKKIIIIKNNYCILLWDSNFIINSLSKVFLYG